MNEVLLTSAITGMLSLLGTLAGAYFSNRRSTALIAYRLEQLEKKVNLHNSVIERTYILEKDTAVLRTEIDDIKGRFQHEQI